MMEDKPQSEKGFDKQPEKQLGSSLENQPSDLSEVLEIKKEDLENNEVLSYIPQGSKYWVERFRRPPVAILDDQATIATDATLGNRFRVTLGGNRTLGNPTGMHDGQYLVWELIQDGTGSRTISLDTKFVVGNFVVTLTTTADKRDFIQAYYNQTTDKFYIVAFVKNY